MSQNVRSDWIKKQIAEKKSLDEYKSQFERPRTIIMDIEEEYDYGDSKNAISRFLASTSFGLLNEQEYEKFLKECPLGYDEKKNVEHYWSLNRLFYSLGESVAVRDELDKKFQEKSTEVLPKKREVEGAGDFWDWHVKELYKGAEYIAEIGFSQR